MAYSHGLFSWTDISTTDPKAGAEFYSSLFGWTSEEQFDDEGNYIYTMFQLDGQDVAGMGPLPKEMQDQGIPPMWNSYINVLDVDEAVEKIEKAGGQVMGVMDVMSSGRMAIAMDPTGAAFMLWQADEHKGAGIFNAPGSMTWNELMTRDIDKAKSFYADVAGWDYVPFEGMDAYWLIAHEGKSAGSGLAEDNMNGGMMQMDDENFGFPDEVPPHWMVYFAASDTDAIAEKVVELGGTVAQPAFDSPAGRMAILSDPQGGTFAVITSS